MMCTCATYEKCISRKSSINGDLVTVMTTATITASFVMLHENPLNIIISYKVRGFIKVYRYKMVNATRTVYSIHFHFF